MLGFTIPDTGTGLLYIYAVRVYWNKNALPVPELEKKYSSGSGTGTKMLFRFRNWNKNALQVPELEQKCSSVSGTGTKMLKIDNLNVKAKLFDFEARILIGWLANTLTSQLTEHVLQSQTFLFLREGCLSFPTGI